MGLRFSHAEALDQQPLGAVDQSDLLDFFLDCGLFCLHLTHPLPSGAEDPQILRHHLHIRGLGQRKHAVADHLCVNIVKLIVPDQKEDPCAAAGADVHGQAHPKIIRQRGVDQHDVKRCFRDFAVRFSNAVYRCHRPVVRHREQRHDLRSKAVRSRDDQYAVCPFLKDHERSSFRLVMAGCSSMTIGRDHSFREMFIDECACSGQSGGFISPSSTSAGAV